MGYISWYSGLELLPDLFGRRGLETYSPRGMKRQMMNTKRLEILLCLLYGMLGSGISTTKIIQRFLPNVFSAISCQVVLSFGRERGTVRMKCCNQKHNMSTIARFKTHDPRISCLMQLPVGQHINRTLHTRIPNTL